MQKCDSAAFVARVDEILLRELHLPFCEFHRHTDADGIEHIVEMPLSAPLREFLEHGLQARQGHGINPAFQNLDFECVQHIEGFGSAFSEAPSAFGCVLYPLQGKERIDGINPG